MAATLMFAAGVAPSAAQNFNQFLVFGPSLFDSGYFKLSGGDNHFTVARANGGAMTPSAGIMNTDILASRFGLTDVSLGVSPLGSNYAVSGARISGPNPLPNTAGTPSITQQMSNYLAQTGGRANGNALYLISAGSNDVSFARNTFGNQTPGFFNFLSAQAATFVGSVVQLQAAGARYILIPQLGGGDFLNSSIYNGLANAGVRFIPADQAALIAAVRASPDRFGLTSTAAGTLPPVLISPSACQPPSNGYSGYGLYCIPSTTPRAQVATLATADALQTRLFSDDIHLSPAGQKLQADYYYSLIAAPSQISYLTENAIQTRRGVIRGIQDQIDLTQRRSQPGMTVWFNGDVSTLRLNGNAVGFPSDPSLPAFGTLGASYAFTPDVLVGGAVTVGSQSPSFSSGGGFRQDEIAATLFGAARRGPLWANALVGFGWLQSDVNRIVPLGLSFDSNQGSTRGQNFSFAAQAGYDLRHDAWTHGPVAGIEVQSVGFKPFTETGSFTSLSFSDIGRQSMVTALGYRAAFDYGAWRPFVQATWNHELEDTRQNVVSAALTTIVAPRYALPIVQFGRDWATAVAGTTLVLDANLTGLLAFNAQLGQNGATNYGGRFGLNYAFAPLRSGPLNR